LRWLKQRKSGVMPDERERDEGPERPTHVRHQLLRTQHPGPEGNLSHDRLRAAVDHRAQAREPTSVDPRFVDAPMSLEERKALHQAQDLEAAYELLGQMQEARHKDGRLAPDIAVAGKPAPLLHAYLSLDEQIARGARPVASELAYLQGAPTPEEEKARTDVYLEGRSARNKALFERSRHWGPELDRLARGERPPDGRLSQGGIEGWRSDLAEQQKVAFRVSGKEVAGLLPADARFATAPLTRDEMHALGNAENEKAAARLLGQFHEARLEDGRLAGTPDAHARKAQIHQALPLKQQIELGLRPTAEQLAFMLDGAMHGQEHARTMTFIAERKAHNRQWFGLAREGMHALHEASETHQRQLEAAEQERASSYWHQRELKGAPAAEREARTEKGERRTDKQPQSSERTEGRETRPERNGHDDRTASDGGGRGR
jgi:hypothetical protein